MASKRNCMMELVVYSNGHIIDIIWIEKTFMYYNIHISDTI